MHSDFTTNTLEKLFVKQILTSPEYVNIFAEAYDKRWLEDPNANTLANLVFSFYKKYHKIPSRNVLKELIIKLKEKDVKDRFNHIECIEFLDYILAVKVVDSLDEAIEAIATHSTGHSDAIVTENIETANAFVARVDSAAVYVNASTRFTDGGEFGKGCEIGISTQKLHARGPRGLEELTSYKYIIHGNGQTR